MPSKYIEFRNRDEQIDFDTKMKQLQAEMRDLLQQEETSNKELKSLFEKLGYMLWFFPVLKGLERIVML